MDGPVLVTGANGFLGRHLVAELRRRGQPVRALLRPGTAATFDAADAGITYHFADITEARQLAGVADGCAAIIHAAALASVNPARNPAVWAANLGGTVNVLALARQATVGRLVYVGTANVFGFGTKQNPGDETQPYAGSHYGLDYMDSKRAATDLVQRAAGQHIPAVLVHPTFMLGPEDAKPTSNALLLELYRRRLPGYPPGGKNYVHVRDVATATVNALTMGRVGESYILGNENLSYRDAFARLTAVLGVPAPRWPIPAGLAVLYGTLSEQLGRLRGRPTQLNAAMAAVANDGHYFSAAKARAELALPQTSIEQAAAEAFAWFRAHDYV